MSVLHERAIETQKDSFNQKGPVDSEGLPKAEHLKKTAFTQTNVQNLFLHWA